MKVVLVEGVLKLRFVASHDLRPARLTLTSENPTRHVLRFNDEYAEAR